VFARCTLLRCFLILMVLVAFSSCSSSPFKPIKPLRVKFGPFVSIFEEHHSSELLDAIKAGKYGPYEAYLDAVTVERAGRRRGKLWVQRVGEKSYKAEFREGNLNMEQVRSMRLLSEATQTLGKWDTSQGPDSANTVLHTWGFCNGQPGTGFRATEVFIGSDRTAKIVLIMLREGRPD